MKKFSILAFITTLFFTGCSKKSSIEIDANHQLILKTSTQKEYVIARVIERIKTLHVEYMDIEIYSLRSQDEGSVVYEKIEIESDRVFNYNTKENIRRIFDAQGITSVYADKELEAYQLKLHDKSSINILALLSSDTTLHLLYGFSNSEFTRVLKLIDSDRGIGCEVLHVEAITLDSRAQIKSDWENTNLIVEPLTMIITE